MQLNKIKIKINNFVWCFVLLLILLIVLILLKYSREYFKDTNKDLGYNNLTIVTAYFKINRTRNIDYTQGRTSMAVDSDGMYREWMKGILSYKGPMVIYTDEESYSYIKKLREGKRTDIIKTRLEDLEAYPYFKDNKLNSKNYYTMVWKENDKEEVNKKLYTLWNSKFSLLKQAIDENKFDTPYYAWFDIGYIREADKRLGYDWPNKEKLEILDDKVLFKVVYGGPTCEEGGLISGGFIGCNRDNIHKVHSLFLDELKKRSNEGTFAGNDQELYNDIRCAHPDLIKGIKGLDTDYWDHVEGKWFYMIPYFYNKIFKVIEKFMV